MVYGPFSLEGAIAAELGLKLWVNSELNYDHLYYLVSVDNAHFYGRQISGHDEDWFGASLDLASVPTLGSILGEPQVWVAIVFQSDASINLPEGAYVSRAMAGDRRRVGRVVMWSSSRPP
jgi:hypothetical protein